ncbi:MAG: hypothetical protein MJZ92_01460, partial [Paludibacteraceae bacterium]|nr:hypothetical protein [Paludibacteraceae bacterium]
INYIEKEQAQAEQHDAYKYCVKYSYSFDIANVCHDTLASLCCCKYTSFFNRRQKYCVLREKYIVLR